MSEDVPSTLTIVQARSSSCRLPGKVMKPLLGEPMIVRQLERVTRSTAVGHLVVATSEESEDDALTQLLHDRGVDVVRGPLTDVLGRFVMAIDAYEPDVVVRLTGDCPLISPMVIDQVVHAFHAGRDDYVSNTMEPTYPDGLDVEVMTASSLRSIHKFSTDRHEREHVTLGIYRRTEQFRIGSFRDPSGADHSHLRWTVDTPDDLLFVETVYGHLYERNPAFEYADVLDLVRRNPALMRSVNDEARNAALYGLNTGAMRHRDGSVER